MKQVALKPEASAFVVANFVMACCWKVPHLPAPGQTLQATGLTFEPGGKGLNVAIGMHRLGLDVRALIACGDDIAGQSLLDLLKNEKISTEAVVKVASASGYGAGMIGLNGQNAIAVYPGANLLLNSIHVEAQKQKLLSSHLVYGQFETNISAVAHAFELAYSEKICTVLNPSPWQELEASVLKRLQVSTQVLIVNETEAQGLLGLGQALHADAQICYMQCAERMISLWTNWSSLRLCIVTLGAAGCLVFSRGEQSRTLWAAYMPAQQIDAVDTVGAGDAFASGFCAVLAHFERLSPQQNFESKSIIELACQWGQWMGTYMASHTGVLDALAPLAQVHDGLNSSTPQRLHIF